MFGIPGGPSPARTSRRRGLNPRVPRPGQRQLGADRRLNSNHPASQAFHSSRGTLMIVALYQTSSCPPRLARAIAIGRNSIGKPLGRKPQHFGLFRTFSG